MDFVGAGRGFKEYRAAALSTKSTCTTVCVGRGGVKPFELMVRVMYFDMTIVKPNPCDKSCAMCTLATGAMTMRHPQQGQLRRELY